MLCNLNRKLMEYLPHGEEFARKRANLSDEDYYAVIDKINEYCDTHETVKCVYFAPGDWTPTVFQALYEACGKNAEDAAMFLGQILWVVLQERDDDWSFYREESIGDNIQGMKYFRINR